MPENTYYPIVCGHCSNISHMRIRATASDLELRGDPQYGMYDESGTIYNIVECPACKEITIISYFWSDSMNPSDDTEYHIVHPKNTNLPIGLPEHIQSSLIAADKVRSIDANAYALLLGRTLELVCLDKEAKGKTLAEMLKYLSDRGDIPEKLVDVAKGLREFRNVGAHAVLGSISSHELPTIRALCNALLEYIYSAPHLAEIAAQQLAKVKGK